jgi:hypothetical protein
MVVLGTRVVRRKLLSQASLLLVRCVRIRIRIHLERQTKKFTTTRFFGPHTRVLVPSIVIIIIVPAAPEYLET